MRVVEGTGADNFQRVQTIGTNGNIFIDLHVIVKPELSVVWS